MYNNDMYVVVEAQHYKPGKGGAIIRSKLRNIHTGNMASDTLRPEDMFEEIFIEQKPLQFLYKDDVGYCFMDEHSYEQFHVSEKVIGSTMDYLKENMTYDANIYNGEILTVTPPIHVILEIKETEPGFRGNTVTGATKPATLETGKVVKVPLFVERGEKVKIDTRTGEYVERA